MLTKKMKQKLILFLKEDIAGKDITTSLITEKNCKAKIILRENAVVSGLEEAKFVFEVSGIKVKLNAVNGREYKKGKVLIELNGKNKKILSSERTALNVLARMSGIASVARQAQKIAGKTRIMLTRKTSPGLNEFDKKAATEAGIMPHRKNLNEAYLIKENHIKFNSITELINKAKKTNKKNRQKKLIEVEVKNFIELKEAIKAKPDVIMLDNFSARNAKKALKETKKAGIKTELSGNINFSNLKDYAELKPEFISMGFLTHSVKSINLSLLLT